jgi:hypothetical protein
MEASMKTTKDQFAYGYKLARIAGSKAVVEALEEITELAMHYMNHEQAHEFFTKADMKYPGLLQDCGSCGCMHPRWFDGDCRQDKYRF